MRRTAAVFVLIFAMTAMGVVNGFARNGDGADILKGMMSDDQMTAYQALGKLRSGELAGDKPKFEIAKNNLVLLLGNGKKDYNIRILAADIAAYFDVKKAVPALRTGMTSEDNPMLKMMYQNALDRIEGRTEGEKYRETPSYVGTPSYRGTPGYYGTPRHPGTPRR